MITSPTYWIVLASTLILFWIVPRGWRAWLLAIASGGYLCTLEPVHTPVFIGLILAFHWLSFRAAGSKRRAWIWLVMAVLAYLAFFKYAPSIARSIAGEDSPIARIGVPLGISYFTFKLIHFVIEVGRGTIKDRSISTFLAYMLLFPIFTAGPIERYDHFLARRSERFDFQDIAIGGTRIAHGLIKQFVIADLLIFPLAKPLGTADIVVQDLHLLPWYKVTGFLVAQYLLTYLNFSAYSDIAIGSSRLFGLRIVENFNWPVLARNIQEFWKRWHISLVNWCQSYIFMPLVGKYRNPYVAVFITFIVIAVWHRASLNWVVWGLHQAVGITVCMRWLRFKRTWKWRPPEKGILAWWGLPVTFGYVATSQAYLATDGMGLYPALRIVAKLLFIELPA